MPVDLSEDLEFFAALDLVGASIGSVVIVYLLARHVLLLRGDLHKDDYFCGDCSKACVESLKGACSDEPKDISVSAPVAITDSYAKFYESVIFYCTFGCLLSYMCYVMLATISGFTMYNWLPFGFCRNGIKMGGVIVTCAKSNLYSVLIARLHRAFHASGVGYNTKLIHTMLASVCVYWLCVCLLAVIYSHGERNGKTNGRNICKVYLPPAEIIAMSVFDFCFSIAVAFMFISALRRLIAARRKTLAQSEMRRSNDQMEHALVYTLIQKYTVLTTVAIVSTLATVVLMGVFVAGFLFTVDAMVNCICLLFMTGKWQPVYDKVCGPLLRCAVYTPCLPCVDLTITEKEPEHAEETVTTMDTTVSKPLITPSLLVLAPTRTVPMIVPKTVPV